MFSGVINATGSLLKISASFQGPYGPATSFHASLVPASGRLAGCRTVTVPASKFPLLRRCRKDRKAFLRALLYPGRFCYSWMTGFMGSNDDAVAFLAKTRPARLDLSLITRALRCRHADADPDVLFPARTRLPSQVDACATLLAGVPLAGRSNARGRR